MPRVGREIDRNPVVGLILVILPLGGGCGAEIRHLLEKTTLTGFNWGVISMRRLLNRLRK